MLNTMVEKILSLDESILSASIINMQGQSLDIKVNIIFAMGLLPISLIMTRGPNVGYGSEPLTR